MMQGYNFTERVRKVLARAREESAQLRHEYVGTEHMLLGLIAERESVATTVLDNLGVNGKQLREVVIAVVKRGDSSHRTGPDLPYTSRAKKVLELAMTEARGLDHTYVGTEHLLLGLVREEKGIAAQVLLDAGVTLDGTREEVLRVLGGGQSDEDVGAGEAYTPVPHRMMARLDPKSGLPEPIKAIVTDAFEIAKERGAEAPSEADLLHALIFSSREVAAAFAARDIEVDGLIAEIRKFTDQR